MILLRFSQRRRLSKIFVAGGRLSRRLIGLALVITVYAEQFVCPNFSLLDVLDEHFTCGPMSTHTD